MNQQTISNSFVVKNTRFKKYKAYRKKIANSYSSFQRKLNKNDQLQKINKKISKFDPSLLRQLQKEKNWNFLNFSHTWTEQNHSLIKLKKNYEKLKIMHLDLVLKNLKLNNEKTEIEPFFDKSGKLAPSWLSQDSSYLLLKEKQEWIEKMTNNEKNIKKEIFINSNAFDKALLSVQKIKESTNLLPLNKTIPKLEDSLKNKVWFKILFSLFIFFLLISFIFVLIFFLL